MKTKIYLLRKEKDGGNILLAEYDYLLPLSGDYYGDLAKFSIGSNIYYQRTWVWNIDTQTIEIYVKG